jgi:predicted Zn-ribbon and HTH transcriptional regulator
MEGEQSMSNNKVTFEDVLSAVDKLTPEQIDMLRKRIDDRLISFITPFSEEEITKDVEKVIQSVRARSGKREYEPVTCSVCGKTQKADVIIIRGTPYCGDCFEKIRATIR